MQQNKLTGEEVLKKIEEYFESINGNVDDYAHGDYEEEELNLGKIEQVDRYGGEGKGETWYIVNHFVDHDVYIKTNGFYSSYSGTDFNDGYGEVVKPVEKTVIFYE